MIDLLKSAAELLNCIRFDVQLSIPQDLDRQGSAPVFFLPHLYYF